jgi:MSHA biogenesis protein MshM
MYLDRLYLEHFGLQEAPFRLSPHTEFFFLGANRGATLEALIYAITHDEGIIKVSGEVGSGKTMLCQMLFERLPAHIETVYLANPSLSPDGIVRAIAEEVHVDLPDDRSHLPLRALQERLIEIYGAGRQVVVLIDEAHAMSPETLEQIRQLSNLETNRHRLLHIVLFGQPQLDEALRQIEMRPLKERITHNFALEPLRQNDIADYLMFRIRAAGYSGPNLFTPGAIERISGASEGLTRRINLLADKAMLAAFAEDTHMIDGRQINTAIHDAQLDPIVDSRARARKWLFAGIIAVAVTGSAFLVIDQRASGKPPPTSAPNAQPVTAAPPPVITAPVPATAAPQPPATAAPQHLAAPPTATAPTLPAGPPRTLDEHIAASQEWLKVAPDTHYVIQLLNTDGSQRRLVADFLAVNAAKLDPQQVRVYRSTLSGRERLGVIYGDYPSRAAANADLARIAKASQVGTPYIRAVSKLR